MKSNTDSEVISCLIDFFTQQLNVENAIVTALKLLKGSYALLIVDNKNPNIIYAAKNKSPLLIGETNKGNIIASDVLALTKETNKYLSMKDKTFLICTANKVELFNFDLEKIEHEKIEYQGFSHEINLGENPHFMLKEINEQPDIIKRQVEKNLHVGGKRKDLVVEK